jgi:hypothetical protein
VLLLEPLIPSLFLLLVGLSLARSFDAAIARGGTPRAQPYTWLSRQARRALLLWAVSCVFFTLELGFRVPDALVASGILSNIAFAVLVTGALLAIPRPRIGLALALAAGTAAFVWLDRAGMRIFAVNIGNSPYLPLWLFALAGALWGTALRSGSGAVPARGRRVLQGIVGVAGTLFGVWMIARHGLDTLFTKPFGRSDAGRWMAVPLTGGEPVHLAYYNLRPVLATVCLGLHLAALTILRELLAKLPERVAGRVFALGRHALGAYILHLALLAVLVVTAGRRPLTTGWQGGVVLAGIAVICVIWAIWRENRRENSRENHLKSQGMLSSPGT